MKSIKRVLAILLTAIISLSFAGCHKKNEIAVKIGDVEFTSAYYMCALINANMEAKSKVYETLSDDEKSSSDVDYYSKKIDDKDFVKWVEDKAIDTLKKIASYKLLCKENKVELDKETVSNAEMTASYYWSSYGYSVYFEPNGVGENTYKAYTKDSFYSEEYFKYVYGEKGEKAVSADDIKSKIYDNFIIADILTAQYEENATDEAKAALKTKFENYAKQLNSGEKTFEQVYIEYNGKAAEDNTSDTDSETETAKDKYAQVIGSEDTNYSSSYYSIAKDMKTGETKVDVNEGKTGVYLILKQDIKADPYYITSLDMQARHLIADKDFEKLIQDYADKLTADINNYAVKQFKVKKIEEPSYNQ